MPTALDIITLAMKDAGVVGVGQTPLAEDTNDAFVTLQQMLDQWQTERWLVYTLADVSFVSTGSLSYTIGSGGNIDVLRPDRIEAAFARQINNGGTPVDTPIRILNAREDYDLITTKTITSYPIAAFYDAAYPLGNLYVWPVPMAGVYEIHLSIKGQFARPTQLTDDLAFPPEYMMPIRLNLAVMLRDLYGKPERPGLNRRAVTTLATVRRANTQMPVLMMPGDLAARAGRFNIFSGQ